MQEEFTTSSTEDKIVLPEICYSIGKAEVFRDGEWVETPFNVFIDTELKPNGEDDKQQNYRITQTR